MVYCPLRPSCSDREFSTQHPATPKHDLTSVRYCMIAAAPISAELTKEILNVMPNIHLGQAYGVYHRSLVEQIHVLTSTSRDDRELRCGKHGRWTRLYPLGDYCKLLIAPLLFQFPISQKVGTLGSGGQLVPGTVAKVVKTDGSLGGFNERGELWVKGGQIALGYYGDEAARVLSPAQRISRTTKLIS